MGSNSRITVLAPFFCSSRSRSSRSLRVVPAIQSNGRQGMKRFPSGVAISLNPDLSLTPRQLYRHGTCERESLAHRRSKACMPSQSGGIIKPPRMRDLSVTYISQSLREGLLRDVQLMSDSSRLQLAPRAHSVASYLQLTLGSLRDSP